MSLGRDIAYGFAAALSSPIWGVSLLRTGKWRTDWGGRLGKTEPKAAGAGKRVLIHAVSVGEVNATRALVAELKQREPGLDIVIAATTNTGFARATSLYAAEHTVVRYPFDFGFAVRRFLEALRPDVVVTVELELWPNFIEACGQRGIPVCVVNGRLSARSFKGYRRFHGLVRKSFEAVTSAGVQTQDYADRFIALGTPRERVHVLDTMKWDTAQVADAVDGADELAAAMGIDPNKPLVVAGSTGPGEEAFLAESRPEGVQLMLVPRKPERFDEAAAAVPGVIRRTERPDGQAGDVGGEVFLLDTMGELRKAYALADVVMVGRSFLGMYGSDMMEPIALGKPTIVGTHHSDFQSTVDAFVEGDGIRVSDTPWEEAQPLLADAAKAAELAQRGRQVILSRQGSTAKHADMLLGVLEEHSGQGQGASGQG